MLIEEDRSRSINWCCFCSCLKRHIIDHPYPRVKKSNDCSQFCENLQCYVYRFEWILFCLWLGNYVQHTCLFFWTIQKFDSLVWIKCKISYFSCSYQFEYTFNLKMVPLVHNMSWRGCSVNLLIPRNVELGQVFLETLCIFISPWNRLWTHCMCFVCTLTVVSLYAHPLMFCILKFIKMWEYFSKFYMEYYHK